MSINEEESEHDAYVRLAKQAAQRAHSAIDAAESAAQRLGELKTDAIAHGYLLGSPEHDRALGITHMQMAQSRQMAAAYASLGTLYASLAALAPQLITMPEHDDALSQMLMSRIDEFRKKDNPST